MGDNGWSQTPTWWRALAVAAVGACAAVLTRRADVVVLVSGFVMAAALEWRPPQRKPPAVRTDVPAAPQREGDPVIVRHRVDGHVDAALTLVARTGQGVRVLTSWGGADPPMDEGPARWGVHDLSPVAGHWLTRWGGWAAAASVERGVSATVLPSRAPTSLRALPPPVGLGPGADPSTRRGDGTDYTGLRALGDDEPPRRVNWPATLRTGQMVVTSTLRDTAGTYLVIVDGEGAGIGHVEAIREVAGLMSALIRAGGDVALTVLGCGDVMPVPVGSGPAHLARLERSLARAGAAPDHGANDHQPARAARLRLPRGSVVVAYSPLSDPATTTLLARLSRAGHRVCVVDTAEPDTSEIDEVARRVRHLRLEVNGMPVTSRADGPGAGPQALAALRRRRQQ